MKAVGEAMAGTIGSSRYPFTVDTPKNRDFVKRFFATHNVTPTCSTARPTRAWSG